MTTRKVLSIIYCDDYIASLIINQYGALVEWYWQGKTDVLGERPVHCKSDRLIWDRTRVSAERPAANRLSHDTALTLMIEHPKIWGCGSLYERKESFRSSAWNSLYLYCFSFVGTYKYNSLLERNPRISLPGAVYSLARLILYDDWNSYLSVLPTSCIHFNYCN